MSQTSWRFIKGGVVFGHPSDEVGIYVNQIVPIRSARLVETILWHLFKVEPNA